MNRKHVSIIGAGILFLGCFLPAIYLPFIGGMPYVKGGQGDGIVVATLAAVGALVALSGRIGWASVAAWLSLVVIIYDLNQFGQIMSQMPPTDDNPFASILANSVRLGEGWAVMFIGIAAMILCSFGRRQALAGIPTPLTQRYSNSGFGS